MLLLATEFSRYQLRVTLSVCFLSISCGAFLGYTSPAIHSMNEDPTFPKLSVSDISWIGSLGPLGAMCGCLFTAAAIPRCGARQTILFFAAPALLVSWFGIYFAESAIGLFISRFLGGIGTGITTCSAPLYVIGIAATQHRGRLGILPQLLMLIGIAISYGIGSGLEWKNHAMACCMLVLPAFVLIPLAPDNPRWLFSKDRQEDAMSALLRLNDKVAAAEEFDRLRNQDYVRTTLAKTSIWAKLKNVLLIKSIATALGIMTFQQFTGINGVTFYAITIFKQSPGDINWGVHIPAIIFASVQVIASLVSTFFIDKAGRKMLLIVSASLTTLASTSIGFYFWAGTKDLNLFWVPLVILIVFAFGFAIGYGPVTWLIVTEILPEEIRSVINPFVLAYSWLCVFGVTKSFPLILSWVDIYGVFWIYAGFSVLGLLFVILIVPETRGKSFEEVRKMFESRTNKTDDKLNNNT